MVYRTLAGLALLGLTASAASAAERPVVVELFTSQGCSSCPPANAYLNELAKGRHDVLPLAFHVTYWDRLGWEEPFSLEGGPHPPGPLRASFRGRLLPAGDRRRRPLQPCRLGPRGSRAGNRTGQAEERDGGRGQRRQ